MGNSSNTANPPNFEVLCKKSESKKIHKLNPHSKSEANKKYL